jgi:hypothetical protein
MLQLLRLLCAAFVLEWTPRALLAHTSLHSSCCIAAITNQPTYTLTSTLYGRDCMLAQG